MENKRVLKKAGINVTSQLSVLEVNRIATIISNKICNAFSEHNIVKSDLFSALSRIPMYYAEFEDCSAAKYDFKNDAIYFKAGTNFKDIELPAIHECLHFIQAIKNKSRKIKKTRII